jgi:hypothetical protein
VSRGDDMECRVICDLHERGAKVREYLVRCFVGRKEVNEAWCTGLKTRMGKKDCGLAIEDIHGYIRARRFTDIYPILAIRAAARDEDIPSMMRPGNLAKVFIDLSVIPLHLRRDQARNLHKPLCPGSSSADASSVIP